MSEKASFISFSESFHAHLNETYAKAEIILKTLSSGDISCLPPVSVASRVSRKRWRDDLQELEKKYADNIGDGYHDAMDSDVERVMRETADPLPIRGINGAITWQNEQGFIGYIIILLVNVSYSLTLCR